MGGSDAWKQGGRGETSSPKAREVNTVMYDDSSQRPKSLSLSSLSHIHILFFVFYQEINLNRMWSCVDLQTHQLFCTSWMLFLYKTFSFNRAACRKLIHTLTVYKVMLEHSWGDYDSIFDATWLIFLKNMLKAVGHQPALPHHQTMLQNPLITKDLLTFLFSVLSFQAISLGPSTVKTTNICKDFCYLNF